MFRTLLVEFSDWVRFILRECLRTDSTVFHSCIHVTGIPNVGFCETVHCLVNMSSKAYSECKETDNVWSFAIRRLGNLCKLEGCAFGFLMPLPPKLKR